MGSMHTALAGAAANADTHGYYLSLATFSSYGYIDFRRSFPLKGIKGERLRLTVQ